MFKWYLYLSFFIIGYDKCLSNEGSLVSNTTNKHLRKPSALFLESLESIQFCHAISKKPSHGWLNCPVTDAKHLPFLQRQCHQTWRLWHLPSAKQLPSVPSVLPWSIWLGNALLFLRANPTVFFVQATPVPKLRPLLRGYVSQNLMLGWSGWDLVVGGVVCMHSASLCTPPGLH